MAYVQALEKAWSGIHKDGGEGRFSVKFLADTYDVDPSNKTVSSLSCNVSAKEYTAIIILHYLARKLSEKAMPAISGKWINFNELDGGEAYYTAFKKRTIDRIIKKFGANPEGLSDIEKRLPAKRAEFGDMGVIIYPFEETPILITLWKADAEFGPDANILFDSTVPDIFCTEDIVVLTEMVVHSL